MAKDHEEDVFDKQEDCRLTIWRNAAKRSGGGLQIRIAPHAFCLESVAARHSQIAASSSSIKELPAYPHTAGW
jgi:hypothetical protein